MPRSDLLSASYKKALARIPKAWTPLPEEFFARASTLVARELLGCQLLVKREGKWIGGLITETEAYSAEDPASHSFNGMTKRNRSMFGPPGMLYVYRIYGIHWCLNVSTGQEGEGAAVLFRAIAPSFGSELMIPGASPLPDRICSGPGRLCTALDIDGSLDGQMIHKANLGIWRPDSRLEHEAALGPRIGISKATDLDWRFGIRGHPTLSRPFPKQPAQNNLQNKGAEHV